MSFPGLFKQDPYSWQLGKALLNRDVSSMSTLLMKGADVNSSYEDGRSLLATAIKMEFPEGIRLLLSQKNIKLNAAGKGGVTPLHIAAAVGNLGAINLLLDRGVKTHAQTSEGATPLHCAVWNRQAPVVEMLSESTSVEAFNLHAPSLLRMACSLGFWEIASFFIERGTNTNTRDEKGFNARLIIHMKGHDDLMRRLSLGSNDREFMERKFLAYTACS